MSTPRNIIIKYHTVQFLHKGLRVQTRLFCVLVLLVSINCNFFDHDEGGIDYGVVYPVIDLTPSWGPDGTIIYTHSHITHIDSASGDAVLLPESSGLWMINPDGSNNRMFFKGAGNADWSPDGQWIAFNWGARIWKIKANGDSLTQLTFGRNTYTPRWSPDGKKIVYYQSVATDSHPAGCYIMNADGSDDHYIPLNGYDADWSPDGSKLIYEGPSYTFGESQIWIADTNGMNKKQLTSFDSLEARCPAFSPDGSEIAFTAGGEGLVWWLAKIDAQGGNFQILVSKGGCPSWSPDGSQIVYGGFTDKKYNPRHNGVLYIINKDGTGKRQLTFGPEP